MHPIFVMILRTGIRSKHERAEQNNYDHRTYTADASILFVCWLDLNCPLLPRSPKLRQLELRAAAPLGPACPLFSRANAHRFKCIQRPNGLKWMLNRPLPSMQASASCCAARICGSIKHCDRRLGVAAVETSLQALLLEQHLPLGLLVMVTFGYLVPQPRNSRRTNSH